MLYKISPFFQSLFRRTETLDTRQAIRREETTAERRKKDDEEKRKPLAGSVTDETEVSVDSILSFLNDMLKENTAAAQEQSFSSMADNITASETPNAPSQPTGDDTQPRTAPSKAANAYQATATKIEAPNYYDGESVKPGDGAHALTLDSKNRKTLERFVTDLKELSDNGVTTLNISRAGTFFESLREAIDYQKIS